MAEEDVRQLDHVDDASGNVRTVEQLFQVQETVVGSSPPVKIHNLAVLR